MRASRHARPFRRTEARAGALPRDLPPRRRRARCRRQGAPRRDHRAPRDARHRVQPERAGRRAGLRARRSRTKPSSPGCPDFMREAMRSEAQERGLDGHVVTLSRSSVEPFLQFATRRDLREKVFRAFISRGDNGGATDNKAIIAEMVQASRRTRAAARLCRLRPLPARRCHGEDAGRRARPPRHGLGARARTRARRSRRHAGAGAGGRRQLRARAVGLALLRGKAAAAALRFRRGRDQAVPQPRADDRGRLLYRGAAVRPDLRAAHGRAGLASRRARMGGARRRRQTRSACSSATISRGRRSAAAPG